MDNFSLQDSQDENLDLLNLFQTDERHHSNTKFKCRVCSKYLSSKHCLKEHTYTHTNERPYSCEGCDKLFKHASQLSIHKKMHREQQGLTWPKLTYLMETQKPSLRPYDVPIERIELPEVISKDQVWTLPDVVSI